LYELVEVFLAEFDTLDILLLEQGVDITIKSGLVSLWDRSS
jgi:hypothetical protein